MSFAEHILVAIGFLTMTALTGAGLAFGFGYACRWMAWAPINITVNSIQREET